MYRKFILGILLITLLFSMVGCLGRGQENQQDGGNGLNQPNQGNTSDQNNEEQEEEIDPIKEQIQKMTIDEKIGQIVIMGLDGYTIDDTAKRMIEDYYVGGFIFFGRNVKDSTQLLQLINSLKDTNSGNNIPLFISVDEEGGKVSRVPNEFIKIPTNRTIGQKNDGKVSYQIGSAIGETIKSFGFNMNFAPILDIDSNPKNPVIGDRSYGSNEKIVSELGIEAMKGIQSKGVIPVVKHFPGHGDTAVDSHISLPTVNKDLKSLMEFELIPFKESIKNGADAVMVAHILFNEIEPENPATLSKVLITDILRDQLNFNGVVITDDLTMGAIMENYDIGDAAVRSVKAGSDIVLVCHDYDNGIEVLNALKNAVEERMISEERIDESVYRVLELKKKYDLTDDKINSIDINRINAEITAALEGLRN